MITSVQANKYSVLGNSNKILDQGKVTISDKEKLEQARLEEKKAQKEAEKKDQQSVTSIQGDLLTISDVAKRRLEETKLTEQIEMAQENATKNNGVSANGQVHESLAVQNSGMSEELQKKLEGEGLGELKGYSEYELKELVKEGQITQHEYDEEIEKRKEKTEENIWNQ